MQPAARSREERQVALAPELVRDGASETTLENLARRALSGGREEGDGRRQKVLGCRPPSPAVPVAVTAPLADSMFSPLLKLTTPSLGTFTVESTLSTWKWSSACRLKNSCRNDCPTFGSAGIRIPGLAPPRPACHEPSVLVNAAIPIELGGRLAEVPDVSPAGPGYTSPVLGGRRQSVVPAQAGHHLRLGRESRKRVHASDCRLPMGRTRRPGTRC